MVGPAPPEEEVEELLGGVDGEGGRERDERVGGEQEPLLLVGLAPEHTQPQVQTQLNTGKKIIFVKSIYVFSIASDLHAFSVDPGQDPGLAMRTRIKVADPYLPLPGFAERINRFASRD